MDPETTRQPDERPRKAFSPLPQRSTASANWRVKDDSPRAEVTPKRQPRESSGNEPSRSQQELPEPVPGTRLYVGNLLYTAQRDDVSAFFNANGFHVVNLSMSIDPMTGRNPSYCFADLETAEEASRAMTDLNGQDLMGRPVRLNPGVAKKTGDSPALRTKSYNRGWKTESNSAGQEQTRPAFERWTRNDAPAQWNNPQSQSRRLYVGGLPRMEPQSAVDSAMQELFTGFEVSAVSKIISPHESKRDEPGDHYYLFVDLVNSEDMEPAIEALDGAQTPWGGIVRVNRAKDNRDRKVNREQFGFQRDRESRPPTEWRKGEARPEQ